MIFEKYDKKAKQFEIDNTQIDKKLRMLEGTARIISNNFGIDIVFSKNGECNTSLKVMTLPYNKIIDETFIIGLMGHEVGHIKLTNFDIGKKIVRINEIENRQLLFVICNVLEDVRIEINMEQIYPGFKSIFKKLIKMIKQRILPLLEIEELQKNLISEGKTNKEIKKIIRKKIQLDLEILKLDYQEEYDAKYLNDYLQKELKRRENVKIPVIQKILAVLLLNLRGFDSSFYPQDIRTYVSENLLKIGELTLACKNTDSVLEVAIKIYKILEKSNKENNKIKIENKFSKNSKITKNSKIKKILSIEEQIINEIKNSVLVNNIKPPINEIKDLIKEAIKISQSLKENNNKKYTIHPLYIQKDIETEWEITVDQNSIILYNEYVKYVNPQITFIKKRLLRIINNKKYARWFTGESKGKRIDRNSLYKIPNGERKIFKKKIESNIQDICFSLVIDESGSMVGEPAIQARYAAIMFGEILSELQIAFEVIGYTTAEATKEQKANEFKYSNNLESYNRATNCRHNMYKRFEENYKQVKTKLTKISYFSENYDQDHIEFIWSRVKKRKEKKKLIIWLSDGLPCGGIAGKIKLKKIIKEISDTKETDIIGIGIRSDYIEEYYKKYIVIENVKQLGMNVVKLIECGLKGG